MESWLPVRTLLPGIEAGFFGKLFPEFALVVADFGRHFHLGFDDQIAVAAASLGQASPADAKLLSALSSGRNADIDAAIECWNGKLGAENRFPWSKLGFMNEVMVIDGEVRVFGEADAEEKITPAGATGSRFATASNSQALTFRDARGNFDLVSFCLGDLTGSAANVADVAGALAGAAAMFARNAMPD